MYDRNYYFLRMFKYYAFISYSSIDYVWGKRLQRKLEHYKMPSTLCSEKGWDRYPINPVFFAPTDIQPGDLSEELKKRLRESRHLVVVCSPSSAKSAWVSEEIRYFHSLGRSSNIHLFIVEGVPNSQNPDLECFNPVLKELGIPEMLGANIHEKVSPWPWVNRDRAYVQLITKLLDIEFDQIWQRHQRLKIIQTVAISFWILAITSLMFVVYSHARPFNAFLDIMESTPPARYLPEMSKAVAILYLEDETKTDTISSFSEDAVFLDIPRRYLGDSVRLQVFSEDYIPKDTIIVLDRNMSIGIGRDVSYYGAVRFRLFHPYDKDVADCRVQVGPYQTQTDDRGFVSVDIPLEEQRPAYTVSADVPLVDTILTMPNNKTTAIEIK